MRWRVYMWLSSVTLSFALLLGCFDQGWLPWQLMPFAVFMWITFVVWVFMP
ncbi:hypothetical protein AB0H73_01315 [Streptomyces olivoreticuli]